LCVSTLRLIFHSWKWWRRGSGSSEKLMGFIGPLVVLGLLVFRPIVYKPMWDTFVFRFELYENLIFLSSLKVLPRTIDPYLWIFDSEWRIFLTYLGTSSKWLEFLPFRNPQIDILHFPPFVLGFITIFVLDEFHPKSETILHPLVIRAQLILVRFVSDFRSLKLFLVLGSSTIGHSVYAFVLIN